MFAVLTLYSCSLLSYRSVTGKNWSILQNAVPSKSLKQIKNYYYDHKKDIGKQKAAQEAEKGATIPNGSGVNAKVAAMSTNVPASLDKHQGVSGHPDEAVKGNSRKCILYHLQSY